MAQKRAIDQQDRQGQQQTQKVMIVVRAHAINQPYTVVVLSSNTRLAETAMLAPCWFNKFACWAIASRVEDDPVVGITGHLLRMVLRGNVGRGDDTRIQEEIRESRNWWCANFMDGGDPRPRSWDKQIFSGNKQGHEENLQTSARGESLGALNTD